MRDRPWLSLLASLFGLLASVLPAEQLLAFTAEGIRRGEYWRLWTGHFVHFGSAHLWGDWLAFLVWAALVEAESRRALAVTLLLGAPLLSLSLSLTCPSLTEYRGLSGLDTALVLELILLRGFALKGAQSGPGLGPWLTRLLGGPALQLVGGVSLCLLASKIGYEYWAGHAILAHDLGAGVRLLPAAHAFGALLGLATGWRYRHSPNSMTCASSALCGSSQIGRASTMASALRPKSSRKSQSMERAKPSNFPSPKNRCKMALSANERRSSRSASALSWLMARKPRYR